MEIWQDEDNSAVALIRLTNDGIELLTSRRLPFRPKGILLEARNRLRIELCKLTAYEGKILGGRYISAVREFVDTENVLFYNVKIPAGACRFGLQFARDFGENIEFCSRRPGFAHCQSYSLVSRQAVGDFSLRSARVYFELPRLGETQKAPHYWWAAKNALINAQETFDKISGPFKVTVTIRGPFYRRNIAAILKPLFDGIISALHYDPTVLSTDPGYLKFATKLAVSALEPIDFLKNPTNAILGPKKLLTSNGQLNPADDLCLMGQLLVEYNQSGCASVDVLASPCPTPRL